MYKSEPCFLAILNTAIKYWIVFWQFSFGRTSEINHCDFQILFESFSMAQIKSTLCQNLDRSWSIGHKLWKYIIQDRGQREFSIPGILDENQLHFFSLDHEKWFSEVSILSRNMRVTKWNLVLVSKYENGHMIISISSHQERARKIILNLVSKNCTFSREWEWDS